MSAPASLTGTYMPQLLCSSGLGTREQGIGYPRSRLNPSRPYPTSYPPLYRFSTTRPVRLSPSSPRRWSSHGGIGGPVHSRKECNIRKWHTTMLDEHLARASDQHKCFGGLRCRPRRQIGVNGFTSRVFSDKSSFHLSGHRFGNAVVKQVHVPHATVGPDEPHAASTIMPDTIMPDGILEEQSLDLLDLEMERIELERILSSNLPSHPKLYRGQLRNGLRYLILPNEVPANRISRRGRRLVAVLSVVIYTILTLANLPPLLLFRLPYLPMSITAVLVIPLFRLSNS